MTNKGRIGLLPLALVLLSLLLQGLAPGQAAKMAAVRLDPWANLPICGSNGPNNQGPTQGEGHCHAACLACAAASSVATLADAPAPAAPFAFVTIALASARPATVLQSPAPRPKARDPPSFS